MLVLIIDVEPDMARQVADRLVAIGHRPEIYQSSDAVIRYLAQNKVYDLVLLGSMQARGDCVSLYRRLSRSLPCRYLISSVPLEARNIRSALQIPEEDLFIKPYDIEDLLRRIAEIAEAEGAVHTEAVQHIGELSIDHQHGIARFRGQRIRLSRREFQILSYLALHLEKVVSREEIAEAIWGNEAQGKANVTVMVKNLRNKFDFDNHFIKTVWGAGYMLVNPQK